MTALLPPHFALDRQASTRALASTSRASERRATASKMPPRDGAAAKESGFALLPDASDTLSASSGDRDSDVASQVYDAIEDLGEEEKEERGGTDADARVGTLQRALSSDAILVRGLALAPARMVPHQLSRATEIQLFLERVESIEIRDVAERDEGVVYYVVDIYRYQQQKGIPTRRRASSAAPPPPPLGLARREREPDYQIEQRYSSFARLRRNVANIARKRHPHGRACAYCHSVLGFLQSTSTKPCLKVKFAASVDERKAVLGAFLSELVFAVRESHAGCARSLHGYHMIPALVRRFLAEQTGANFFRY